MSDPAGQPPSHSSVFPSGSRPPERSGMPVVPWVVAGVVILGLLALTLFSRRAAAPAHPNQQLPPAPYAASLVVSKLAMSESTSLSGGKSTFIDGEIQNTGSKTVTGITVQVLFRNDTGMPPQVSTEPLTLIRTREPYVDTQPVSADPIAPGQSREFRLIFESISGNWNMQLPELQIVHVEAK